MGSDADYRKHDNFRVFPPIPPIIARLDAFLNPQDTASYEADSSFCAGQNCSQHTAEVIIQRAIVTTSSGISSANTGSGR